MSFFVECQARGGKVLFELRLLPFVWHGQVCVFVECQARGGKVLFEHRLLPFVWHWLGAKAGQELGGGFVVGVLGDELTGECFFEDGLAQSLGLL